MELHQIRYFLALAETLNFTRAAEKCGVSQPSLTRAIKKLEDEFGAQLVRRERGRTHLTEAGHIVLPRLKQALMLTERARDDATDFSKMKNASLTLGVMSTIGPTKLIPIIDHLGTHLPDLTLTLRTESGPAIIELLLAGKIDIAIVGMPEYPEKLSIKPLYKERFMISCPRKHRFATMQEVPLAELAGERYLRRLNCEYMAFFNHQLTRQSAATYLNGLIPEDALGSLEKLDFLNIRYESEHEDWIQAMVVAGMGCAIVPQYMSPNPELLTRRLTKPEVWRSVGVATVRGRPFTPVVQMFSQLCSRLDWAGEDGDDVRETALCTESD